MKKHHKTGDELTEFRLRQKRKEGQVRAVEWSLTTLERLILRTKHPAAQAALKVFKKTLEKQRNMELEELDQLDRQEREASKK